MSQMLPLALGGLAVILLLAAVAMASNSGLMAIVGPALCVLGACVTSLSAWVAWKRATGPTLHLHVDPAVIRLEDARTGAVVGSAKATKVKAERYVHMRSERMYQSQTLWTYAHPVISLTLGDQTLRIGTQAGGYGWLDDVPECDAPEQSVDPARWQELVRALGLEAHLGRDRLTQSLGSV